MTGKFWYVATPYRKYPGGIEAANKAASQVTAELFDRGLQVYSPIVHSHELARYTQLDPMSDRWLEAQLPFMRAAKGIIVAKLPTWEISYGISWEKGWFSAHKRPIFHLDVPLPLDLPGGLLL